jgi:mono/diheme cytochrome c family protein
MRRLLALALAALGLVGCNHDVAGGRADGPAVFAEVCARCHGPGGQPEAAMVARLGVKDLTSEHVQRQLSDDAIRKQILHGSANKQMPSFDGALTSAQIDAVIAYVRTLGPAAAK